MFGKFITYFFLLCFSIPINSYNPFINSDFSSSDCYESFSQPKIILKLFHYNPSGPQYLNAFFLISVYNLNGIEETRINEIYHFKKMNRPCKSNIMFSTHGIEISEMIITVRISLSPFDASMAFIFYTFKNGFESGEYLLTDKHMYYGLQIKVLDSEEQFFENIVDDPIGKREYLNTLSYKNGEICVVTGNNNKVIIEPIYGAELPNGYITRIIINADYNGTLIRLHEYPAFECNLKKSFNNEKIVFISEGIPEHMLKLSVNYIFMSGFYEHQEQSIFKLKNFMINDVYTSMSYPLNFKKLFIMKNKFIPLWCPDSSRSTIHISEFGNVYYAEEEVDIEIKPKLYKTFKVPRYPLNPCEK